MAGNFYKNNGGFNKGGFPIKKGAIKKSNFGKQSQTPSEPKKYNFNFEYGEYTENNELSIRIGFLVDRDVNLLNQIAPDVFYIKGIKKENAIYANHFLFIKEGKEQDFLNCLDQLKTVLTQTGNYKPDSIENAMERVVKIIDDTPSRQEISDFETKSVNNWKEWLFQLNDPEVRQRFLAFQTSYISSTEFKECMLSPDNITTILTADPQATFVTSEDFWMSHFKRRVKPGSPSLIYTRKFGYLPDAVFYKDPEVIAAGGWKKIKEMSGGNRKNPPAYAWDKKLSKKYTQYFDYKKVRGYDVRFTEPLDPNNDPFMTVANLVNNLTGELNAIAKINAQMIDKENGEVKDYDKKRQGLETNEQLEKYKEFILKECQKEKISVYETGDIKSVISNAVYAYAFKKAEKFNIISDVNRDIFACAVVIGICNSMNITSDKASQCAQKLYGLSEEKRGDAINQAYTVWKNLVSYRIAEDTNDLSREEFYHLVMDFIEKEGNKMKQRFVESCNRLTERMQILEKR